MFYRNIYKHVEFFFAIIDRNHEDYVNVGNHRRKHKSQSNLKFTSFFGVCFLCRLLQSSGNIWRSLLLRLPVHLSVTNIVPTPSQKLLLDFIQPLQKQSVLSLVPHAVGILQFTDFCQSYGFLIIFIFFIFARNTFLILLN